MRIKDRAAAQGQTVPTEELNSNRVLNSLIANQILLQKATDADKADGQKGGGPIHCPDRQTVAARRLRWRSN